MTHPRITVIVPSLNAGAYLERTICSVLDQPWENIELMVVDGGSTDGSVELLARYGDELNWWRSASDTGPAEAINQALTRATGDVVGILPADALYLPETLAHVGARFADATGEGIDWLVSHCVRIGPADEEIGRMEADRPASLCSYLMHDSGVLPMAGTFYRRNLLEAHGAFDVSLRYAFGYEMHARLLAAGRQPTIASRVLAAQREHGTVRGMEQTLRCGREYIDAAMCHANTLALSERYVLWRNCEQRRRIYALAEAEARTDAARRLLWQRLLHHPWWVADAAYRHALLHGSHQSPAPTGPASPLPAA